MHDISRLNFHSMNKETIPNLGTFVLLPQTVNTSPIGSYCSSDGDIYNMTGSGFTYSQYEDIAWSPSLKIMVGVSSGYAGGKGIIRTSTNASTWTNRTNPSTSDILMSIVWSETLGLFVAVTGGANPIITSSNGTSWVTQSCPTINTVERQLVWSSDKSLFIVPTVGGVIKSSNGTSWSSVSIDGRIWSKVEYLTTYGYFIMNGNNGGTSYAIMATSSNGTSWATFSATWANPCTNCSSIFNDFEWSPSLGILVGSSGVNLHYSTDGGHTWYDSNLPTAQWTSVTWSPDIGRFIAVGGYKAPNFYSTWSTDGKTWNEGSYHNISGVNYGAVVTWCSGLIL